MTVTINGTSGITTPGVNSTGSNVLGDNVADTLNVGNGAIVTNSSGNVGIGTSSPGTKLDVQSSDSTAYTTSSNGNLLRLYNTNTTSGVYSGLLLTAMGNGTLAGSASINAIQTGDGSAAIGFTTRNGGTSAERMRIDSSGNLLFNSGYGSVATAYGCRAWVNFNGTGTVAINASGNVSSITDNAAANYTINFTNALPDANYVWAGCANSPNASTGTSLPNLAAFSGSTKTTSALQFIVKTATSNVDVSDICVSVHR